MTLAAPSYAVAADVYALIFTNSQDNNSQRLDSQIYSAIAISGVDVDEIRCDTSTAAKWEKCAHEVFDRDIVPVFNKWVGLPGFAAIIDAKSKRVIGCLGSGLSANEMATELRKMGAQASGGAYLSRANYKFSHEKSYIIKISTSSNTTQCPAAHNVY